ncbi:MAG: hypothetical protein LBQ84_05585 [Flavobacteriaceae bacterium]|jgi:hypothetical protein|nr:hypothetical protein [Flavobacteriaceae bacterium]
METNYINKYFNLILSNLERHLNNPDFPEEEKEKIKIRIEIINELKYNISWQFKCSDDKQISRIRWLATMRKIDALPNYIKKQEEAIRLYDIIRTTMPYINAMNNNLLNPISEMMEDLRDKIDLSGRTYNKDFPTKKEIELAFKNYLEVVLPSKLNGNMFKECYEKIGLLYEELIKISDNQ